MVQLLCSNRIYDKLRQELAKYRIEVDPDSGLALVERGYDQPADKLCLVFDAIDYMDAVKLLVSGVRADLLSLDTLTGLSDNKFAVLEPREVLYLEAGSDGILAYSPSGRYSVKDTLHYYETSWAAKGFIRINKSQLVNLLHVKEIIPWFNSRYVLRLDNGVELEVSKMFSKKLRTTLKM
ncbi:LytTR family DNA-binding domain-containing protein [Cohnella sp.]|uniref:LytTR family DNA-binding domain-containing protein n=1 Tax=Cohnella sp. TaxID=1883426 RepID=UPI00356AD01F